MATRCERCKRRFWAALRRRPLTIAYAGLLVDHLAFDIGREGKYPPRPELHQRLEAIEALAGRGRRSLARQMVMRELADPQIFELLANGDPRIGRALSKPPINLRNVERWAATARARHPPRRGQGKFYPDPVAGPDAREHCALIVSVAWHKDTGKWPGHGNPTAQLICELLWRKAGGAPHLPYGGFDVPGTFATWRKHLVAARRYQPPHAAGVLVANSLEGLSEQRRRLPKRHVPNRRRQIALYGTIFDSDPISAVRRTILSHLKCRYGLFFFKKTTD
jgi:hypothetical protein